MSNWRERRAYCAYRGMRSDPRTAPSYPSIRARCYCVKPAISLTIEQQSTFCMSQNHVNCPLYKGDSTETNNPAIQPQKPSLRHRLLPQVFGANKKAATQEPPASDSTQQSDAPSTDNP